MRCSCLFLALVVGSLSIARCTISVSGRSRLPTPNRIKLTDNYRVATALSDKLQLAAAKTAAAGARKKVAIIGGGLSGLSAAKYLADAGHEPLVLEVCCTWTTHRDAIMADH